VKERGVRGGGRVRKGEGGKYVGGGGKGWGISTSVMRYLLKIVDN
jgi:hypothetical protein